MQLEFKEYRVRKIVNVHRHVDGPWFWDKYSAHPYVGCRSGCEFCYLRGGRYLGRRDPNTFDTLIQVKMNAVELLRQELSRLNHDVIACGDDESHLEDVVRATKDHGGSFVLAGGLTPEGIPAERTLAAARQFDPSLEVRWRQLYYWKEEGKPNCGPPPAYMARLGLMVRELCARYGLKERMPRYIAPASLAVNKRIAERLFLKMYDLELAQAPAYRLRAYRKAAWTIDEWPESIAKLHDTRGEAGLRGLPGIGKNIAGEIARWLRPWE